MSNKTSKQNNPLSLLLCFNCLAEVPEINLFIKNNLIYLNLSCPTCFKDNRSEDISLYNYLAKIDQALAVPEVCSIDKKRIGEKYCIVCKNWLCKDCIPIHEKIDYSHSHRLINTKLNYEIFCNHTDQNQKKTKIKKYCEICKCYVCKECDEKSHKEHNPKTLGFYHTNIYSNDITTLFQKTKELKEKTVNEFNKQLEEYETQIRMINAKIEEIKQKKITIEQVYNENHIKNQQLSQLIGLVDNTVELTNAYGNYNLIKAVQFVNNKTQLPYPETTINLKKLNYDQVLSLLKHLILKIELNEVENINK